MQVVLMKINTSLESLKENTDMELERLRIKNDATKTMKL